MEKLGIAGTLPDVPPHKPPESKALFSPDLPPPPLRTGTTVPDPVFQPVESAAAEEKLDSNHGREAKTLALAPMLGGSGMGLGLPAGGSPFAVGDFIWGKIRSTPWWPGQVYDPARASDCSKMATRRDGAVLVAYFGNASFAWCHPAQLKPFVKDFPQMVRQSSSKGFVSAIVNALDELRRCLEMELTCHCVPLDARAKSGRGENAGRLPFANYAPGEFLERLHGVACDATSASTLETTMLKSWVLAFGKGWSEGSPGYHPRRRTTKLVGKIDLDVPPADLADDKEEKPSWLSGSDVSQELNISKDKFSKSKKSMTPLIAEMDLDAVELSDSEDVKAEKLGSRKLKCDSDSNLDVDGVCVNAEGVSSSRKRERKKSKYLSPPYTDLTGDIRYLALHRSADVKFERKDIEAFGSANGEYPTILKCNSELVQREEDKISLLVKIDSTSVPYILLELLYTALDPLHLKWNRSAKTVWTFFTRYRSSMYSCGSDFVTYQKQQSESCDENAKPLDKVAVDSSGIGKCEGKGRKRIFETKTKYETGLSLDRTSCSPKSCAGRKRKMKEHEADSKPSTDLDSQVVNVSVESRYEHKNIKSKDEANGKGVVLCPEPIYFVEPTKVSPEMFKEVANGGDDVGPEHNLSSHAQGGKSGRKRRKGNTALSAVQRKTDQNKTSASKETPATTPFQNQPLPYIRENLERMISTLTSSSPLKETSCLDELKLGARESLVGDMEGLLKKVNKMLNGPVAGTSS